MDNRKKILLLDLYELSLDRPYIQPYLYLGAFFDYLHIEYEIYRWQDNEEELIELIEKSEIGFVLINLIMGPVLGLVERVCRTIKQSYPSVQIWVGGIAVYYIKELLESCPYIDRVSTGHPRYDPVAYVEELHHYGILTQLPKGKVSFPLLVTNKNIQSFIHQHQGINRPTVNAMDMSTSSGCFHRCSFCYLARTPGWQQPIEQLFDDLASLQGEYNIQYFEFSDDNFPENRQRLSHFRTKVLESGLDISYFCLGSIDVLNAETLEIMIESGLKRLFIGVDAIHPEHIRQLNKNYTQEQIFKTIALVRSYPIDLTLSLVLGSPGQTREQIQELYDWAKSINPEICYAQFLIFYPKTPAYYQAIRLGFCPPKSLKGWAAITDFEKQKAFLNPAIDQHESIEWLGRFRKLSTRQYRSDIGEKIRQLK